ncbi:MAG: hypothetical protein V4534_06570 [Myxococcota bacterium]
MSIAELIGISKEEAYEMAEIGYRLLLQGKSAEAATIFEGLLVLNPDDNYLQNLLNRAKNYDEDLARTIAIEP